MNSFWVWFPLVGSWSIRLGAFVVVPFRRTPEAARTWLLLFFVLPWVALPVYLALGRPRHSPERKARFERLPGVLERAFVDARLPDDSVDSPGGPGEPGSIDALTRSLCRMPPLLGNALELLPAYDETVARLVADIDSATRQVHLEFYIFADDATGDTVMRALERARGRGVTCRVLIDAMGSWSSARTVERRLVAAGARVVRILPLARRWRSSRLDLRNHRKIVVIDERIAYTGSQNLVDASANGALADTPLPNRELVVRLTGPGVLALQAVFLGDWYLETGEEIVERGEKDGIGEHGDVGHGGAYAMSGEPVEPVARHVLEDIRVQMLPSGPDYPAGSIDTLFASLVHDAERQVVLVTPYFIPNRPLAHSLVAAALAGVHVTLIVSRTADSRLVGPAQDSYYAELMRAGVRIERHVPAFLHAKHLRIDERVVVIGSSNMDMRSFELNAEISLIAYGERISRAVRDVEHELLEHAERVDPERWARRPLRRKLVENSARLFSDLL